jgi:formamidopyrimidine-DNA glycosylase
MPELPEVETMCRGVAAAVGATVTGVERPACRLKPISVWPRIDVFRRRVTGRCVEAVDRIGKRVSLRLDSGAAIVFEPRMTGLVLLGEPPDKEHLRFRLTLAGARVEQVLFWDRRGLGSVRLALPEQWQRLYGPEKLGPDALTIELPRLQERLAASRRPIKVALLDQRAVAGIGNLYASEILNVARIHPELPCSRLTPGAWQRLYEAIRVVLIEAIHYEGSTLSDGTYRNALNDPGSYQNHHRVYDRAGERCRSCGLGTVLRIVQAQRSTFYCPVCQVQEDREPVLAVQKKRVARMIETRHG